MQFNFLHVKLTCSFKNCISEPKIFGYFHVYKLSPIWKFSDIDGLIGVLRPSEAPGTGFIKILDFKLRNKVSKVDPRWGMKRTKELRDIMAAPCQLEGLKISKENVSLGPLKPTTDSKGKTTS